MKSHLFVVWVILVFSTGLVEARPLIENLPESFEIHAVGTYQGREPLDIQLDDTGHRVTRVPVIVNRPDTPIFLVLTAYNPVVWDVSWTEGTQIAGVLVSGYHGQALIGIDAEAPYEIGTHETGGGFEFFFAHTTDGLLELANRVEQELGHALDRFHYEAVEGVFTIGEPVTDPTLLRRSDALKLEDFVNPDRPPSGQAGLDVLVALNKIRLATQEDIDAWVLKASEPFLRFNDALRVETYMRPGRTYVVLEAITLPAGLNGSHSRNFILPQDVPLPEGPMSHNSIFSEDGTVLAGIAAKREERTRRRDSSRNNDSALTPLFANWPEEARILGVATYDGTEEVNASVQLDESGNDVKQAEVIVNSPNQPVMLILSAYDPVIWNVGVAEGTELLGVIASGYHGQAVLGIDEKTPLRRASHELGGAFLPMYGYLTDDRLLTMNERLEKLSGRSGIEHLTIEAEEGVFLVGEPLADGQSVRHSDDRNLMDYIDPEWRPAGQYGIDLLVEAGKLRPATMGDIDLLVDLESEAFQDLAPGIRVQTQLMPQFTYVVLDALTIPPGLHGAHSRNFIVPNGIPWPEGDPGHGTVVASPAALEAVAARQIVDFEAWIDDLEDSLGVDGAALAETDSDGDGENDTVEFITGTDPLDAQDFRHLEVAVARNGNEAFLELRVPLRDNAYGADAVLEESTDGREWIEVERGFDLVKRQSIDEWSDLVYLRSDETLTSVTPMRLFRLRAQRARD